MSGSCAHCAALVQLGWGVACVFAACDFVVSTDINQQSERGGPVNTLLMMKNWGVDTETD